ncbi:hypothetical protein ABZ260_33245, partial [Streptosporangium sp. NPDC006013]|uniref:hypothetical protein n=1 Tax=Streptosporangium sp. NPDC006013 TaxID=3155596 RepID=UPI0033A35CA3
MNIPPVSNARYGNKAGAVRVQQAMKHSIGAGLLAATSALAIHLVREMGSRLYAGRMREGVQPILVGEYPGSG